MPSNKCLQTETSEKGTFPLKEGGLGGLRFTNPANSLQLFCGVKFVAKACSNWRQAVETVMMVDYIPEPNMLSLYYGMILAPNRAFIILPPKGPAPFVVKTV